MFQLRTYFDGFFLHGAKFVPSNRKTGVIKFRVIGKTCRIPNRLSHTEYFVGLVN